MFTPPPLLDCLQVRSAAFTFASHLHRHIFIFTLPHLLVQHFRYYLYFAILMLRSLYRIHPAALMSAPPHLHIHSTASMFTA